MGGHHPDCVIEKAMRGELPAKIVKLRDGMLIKAIDRAVGHKPDLRYNARERKLENVTITADGSAAPVVSNLWQRH